MYRTNIWTILALIIVSIGLAACADSTPEPPTLNAAEDTVADGSISSTATSLPPTEAPSPTSTSEATTTVISEPTETATIEPTETPMPPTPSATPSPVRLQLASAAFDSGDLIPDRYARPGDNLSPPLTWGDAPEGTESYVILFVGDPLADGGGTWILWAVYNLPGDLQALPEGLVPDDEGVLQMGGQHLANSYQELAYSGPPTHPIETRRFYVRLYALDTVLETADIDEAAASIDAWIGATELTLLKAMEGHILATGQLTGKYKGESPVQ